MIGCSGWYYKEWEGSFYPTNLPSKEYFSYYTQFFNTVEVNSTFYRYPSNNIVRNWHQKAPNGFKYSLKINKTITHIKKLIQIDEDLKRFYDFGEILKDKMGCFLFQFPKSFVFNLERLESLLKIVDTTYKNVIEFRHPSWWNSKVFNELSAAKIIFCTPSGINLPESIVTLKSNIYIRFHGDATYSSTYSNEELLLWSQKIKATSPKESWIYFNNTSRSYAPTNALSLIKLMG
ncbi:MAG: DUF72 domain-containing protein [Alphaproteobacteria bacterium]|nr:DUF72 domain-containing protein [Alphaproteobacteria bacterium]